MKKLLIVLGILAASTSFAQSYSFNVEVTGKGQPIVLIPGLSCSGDVWDETVQALSNKYQCHVVTLPGFAGQEPIQADNYLTTVGDELIGYIKSNKLKKPIIMGHSLGGFLTLYIGSKEPALASKLISVDGLPFLGALQNPAITEETAKDMADYMKAQMENQTAEQYETRQPQMLKTMITADQDIEVAMEWGRKSDSKTVVQAMYELYTTDLRDDLPRITAPTLVLGAWYGYKDYGATKESTTQLYQLQYKTHNNYRLELSETGKHFIMWDDFDFFLLQVNSFLNEKS